MTFSEIDRDNKSANLFNKILLIMIQEWRSFNIAYLHERHRLSYHQILLNTQQKIDKSILIAEKSRQLKLIDFYLHFHEKAKKKNISFISLKGLILSHQLYGDATLRLSKDFDILIKPEQINETALLLISEGFSCKGMNQWDLKEMELKLLLKLQKDLTFKHRTKGIAIEVHWKLFPNYISDSNQQEQIIHAHSINYIYNNQIFNVLSKEFTLVYLLIHGSQHRWMRLKWIIDIKYYCLTDFNEQLFWQLVDKLKAKKSIHLGFKIYEIIFNEPFPLKHQLFPIQFIFNKSIDILNQPIIKVNNTIYETLTEIFFRLNLVSGWKNKMNILSDLLIHEEVIIYSIKYKLYQIYIHRIINFIKRRILYS